MRQFLSRTSARLAAALTALLISTGAGGAYAAEALGRGESGLPLPRFVSLSSSEVNVRMGPSFKHKVKWKFVKAGLPVEIVREFGNWRRVRYADGEEGWVHHSLLSGRRTALVTPWSEGEPIALRAAARDSARTTALLEPLVLAAVDECDGTWCEIEGSGFKGHIPQKDLWGVYPQEEVK